MKILKKVIQKIVEKKKESFKFICGGEACVEVCNDFGKTIAKLFYNRPDADQKLNFIHVCSTKTAPTSQLAEMAKDKEKLDQTIMKDIYLPFSYELFSRCEGYTDDCGNDLSKISAEEQLEYLKKYWWHHLARMVDIAFSDNSSVKKKY
jgi:hypothetical protein